MSNRARREVGAHLDGPLAAIRMALDTAGRLQELARAKASPSESETAVLSATSARETDEERLRRDAERRERMNSSSDSMFRHRQPLPYTNYDPRCHKTCDQWGKNCMPPVKFDCEPQITDPFKAELNGKTLLRLTKTRDLKCNTIKMAAVSEAQAILNDALRACAPDSLAEKAACLKRFRRSAGPARLKREARIYLDAYDCTDPALSR